MKLEMSKIHVNHFLCTTALGSFQSYCLLTVFFSPLTCIHHKSNWLTTFMERDYRWESSLNRGLAPKSREQRKCLWDFHRRDESESWRQQFGVKEEVLALKAVFQKFQLWYGDWNKSCPAQPQKKTILVLQSGLGLVLQSGLAQSQTTLRKEFWGQILKTIQMKEYTGPF